MSTAERAPYVLISPVRDEAQTIRLTLDSVMAQTVKPAQWVFVDDGSRDETPRILRDAAAKHDFIRVLILGDRGFRQPGPGVVRAFALGLEQLKDADWEFVGKLDGDVCLPGDYYQRVLAAFRDDPRLGIASGACLVPRGNGWRLEKNIPVHTRGPCKVYRRTCLEAIGGLWPTLGWDGLDGFMARMKGWRTRTLPGLQVFHLRPTHGKKGFRGALQDGRGAYYQHYLLSYLLARAALNLFRPPYVLRGIGLVLGYLGAHLERLERIEDPELIRFIHKEQRKRLLKLGGE